MGFQELFKAFCLKMKLSEKRGEPEAHENEKRKLVRAHNVLARHLKAFNQEQYEEARVAREKASLSETVRRPLR